MRLLKQLESKRQAYRKKLMSRPIGHAIRLFAIAALVPILTSMVPPIAPLSLPIDLMVAGAAFVLAPTIVLIPLSILLL